MPAPIITPNQKVYGVADSSLSQAITATNSPVSWSATGLPSGLSIAPSTGVISGTPIAATNNLEVTVVATNADGSDSEIVLFLIEWPNPVSIVRLQKNEYSTTIPKVLIPVNNDVSLLGGYHVYGRWRKTGTIPGGINWEGTIQGLRFWGTPTQAGTFLADFDGPYPPNFRSPNSWGASYGDPLDCNNSYPISIGEVKSVQVQRFQIQFIVEELVAPDIQIDGVWFYGFLTYGEAFSALLRGKMARRGAWGATNKRCLIMRSPTKQVEASSNPHNLDVFSPGAAQVETAIVNAGAGITTSGNAAVIVTATGMTGTPKTISVPLTTAAHTSASLIAAAIAISLNADAAYAALFTATSSGNGVITTRKSSGTTTTFPAPIPDLNVSIANGTCAGITATLISTNTTVGDPTVPASVGNLVWHLDSPLNVLDAQGATAYPLKNNQLIEADIVAADWQVTDVNTPSATSTTPPPLTSPVLLYPKESILDTVAGQRQYIIPETSSQYALFIGTPIDGKKWKTIVSVDIPLSRNAKFFGEFFLENSFRGNLEIMYWTSLDGKFSTAPLASFGLKMLFNPMQQGYANYRNVTPATPPSYDLAYLRSATDGGLLNTAVNNVEGLHGVYNLFCESLPSGNAIAHLTIIAKSF